MIENPIISDLPFTSNSINNINSMNTINNENMQLNNNQRTSLLEKKFTSAMSDTSSYLKPKMNYTVPSQNLFTNPFREYILQCGRAPQSF